MSRRRLGGLAVALVLSAVGIVGVPARAVRPSPFRTSRPMPHRVDGRIDDWTAASPRVAGATAIENGELVHQDHIYDDTGASGDRTARQHGRTPDATSYGTFRYPDDPARYADNAADLFEVRLAADAERVWFLARLNTLLQTDTTVVTLAVDVDGGTERRPWARQAGVVAAGADFTVTLWGTGGEIADLRTGDGLPLNDVAVSTEDNAIEAVVPRAAFGGASRVRVWVTSGLWDATAHGYRAVSPLTTTRVWNAAFRPAEGGGYQDEVQAAALRNGDVTPFSYAVDFDALAAGVTVPWHAAPGRFYVAIIDTGFTIPPLREGVSYTGVPGRFDGLGGVQYNQEYSFLGRFQPYGLYLPSTWDGHTRLPAALVLHGLDGSHSSYNRFPGFLDDVGEHPPTILITPLARGSSFYADYGERETLDVLADAERRWAIDTDRVYLSGYSMGGYGVYRLATLYPDRFAAAVAWAGYTGEFTGLGHGPRDTTPLGDPVLALESLLHVPLLHLMGTNDEVVPVTGQLSASRRLDELGYRHRLDVYPGYEHLSFGVVDDWREARAWLGDRRRERAPRDVVLALSEAWRDPALQRVLHLPGASAWWVTAARQRDGRDDDLTTGVVRATSLGLAGRSHTARTTTGAGITPTPHTQTGIAWDDGAALPIENRLELTLTNIASVDVDLTAAHLDPRDVRVVVTSDGPADVVLHAGAWQRTIHVTGRADVGIG